MEFIVENWWTGCRLKLHSAVHVYIACILNLQEYNLLREINVLQLFGNIRNIYFIHLDLWIDAYLPILQESDNDLEWPVITAFVEQVYSGN